MYKVIQHVVLPNSNKNISLYNRSGKFGSYPISIEAGTTIDFSCFFNYFSIDKWQRYTDLSDFYLHLQMSGVANITFQSALDPNLKQIVLFNNIGILDSRILINSALNGPIFLIIEALSDCVINFCQFEVNSRKTIKNRVAAIVCTYNRENYIRNLICKFNTYVQSYYGDAPIDFYIIDNASTLCSSTIEINDHIHLIHNSNTGGSGGFSRGISEVTSSSEYTHVILMDDDIDLDVETLYRTYALVSELNSTYKDCIIGGAMISMDSGTIIFEAGAQFLNNRSKPNKNNLDVSSYEGCMEYDVEDYADHNGWWYCVYSTNYANDRNLPLPLFIKWDDVEYCLRSQQQVIILNGICVWHDDFKHKYSSLDFYYSIRNLLFIADKLKTTSLNLKIRILKTFLVELLNYRYVNAEFILKAICDYKKGLEWCFSNQCSIHTDLMNNAYSFVNAGVGQPFFSRKDNFIFKVIRLLTFNMAVDENEICVSIFSNSSSNIFGHRKVMYLLPNGFGVHVEFNFKKMMHLLYSYCKCCRL